MKQDGDGKAQGAGRQTAQRRPSLSRIRNYLRHQIVQGKLKPGEQIPLRVSLADRFGASSATVQSAINQLRDDGFVRVEGRQATYVADYPPHLFHYAMILPDGPAEYANGMAETLTEVAETIDPTGSKRINTYFGIETHSDNEAYREMVEAISNDLYAGLIFPIHPACWASPQECPLVTRPSIPRVALGGSDGAHHCAVEAPIDEVVLDSQVFIDRALDYLAGRGRTKIALLSAGQKYFQLVANKAKERNLTIHPYWMHAISVHQRGPHAGTAQNCVHLLLHEGQGERPDGLIITDNTLVESATVGMVAAGVKMPGDLDVVTHCNFPHNTSSMLPVKRLGYDMRVVMRAFIDAIDARRGGGEPSERAILPRFEEELEAATRQLRPVEAMPRQAARGFHSGYNVGAL